MNPTRVRTALGSVALAIATLVLASGCTTTMTPTADLSASPQSGELGAESSLEQPSIQLTASKDSVPIGGMVVLAAQLPSDATGEVVFATIKTDGTVNTVLGQTPLRASYAILDAQAGQLSSGTNSIVAVYRGDSHYEQAESTPIAVTLA
jgi:hypothetical protein